MDFSFYNTIRQNGEKNNKLIVKNEQKLKT